MARSDVMPCIAYCLCNGVDSSATFMRVFVLDVFVFVSMHYGGLLDRGDECVLGFSREHDGVFGEKESHYSCDMKHNCSASDY